MGHFGTSALLKLVKQSDFSSDFFTSPYIASITKTCDAIVAV